MEDKTKKNLSDAFTEESVAASRARIFAMRAEKDGLSHVADLFNAVSESRAVHARRFLRLIRGIVGATDENVKEVFENEEKKDFFAKCAEEAESEGMKIVGHAFEQTLKVEKRIASLRERASGGKHASYHVCGVCGYIQTGEAPESCPVCNAIKSKFKKIPAAQAS